MVFSSMFMIYDLSIKGNARHFDNNETRGYLCEKKRSGYSLVNRVPWLAGIILIFT